MKKIILLLISLGMLALTGCKKDEDNAKIIDLGQLVGTWDLTADYDGELDWWDYEWGAAYNNIIRYQFKEDGTGVYTKIHSIGTSTYPFTYVVDANVVCIKYAHTYPQRDYPLEQLSGNELIWISEDEYTGDDGNTYQDKEIFNRVA